MQALYISYKTSDRSYPTLTDQLFPIVFRSGNLRSHYKQFILQSTSHRVFVGQTRCSTVKPGMVDFLSYETVCLSTDLSRMQQFGKEIFDSFSIQNE